MAVGQIKFYNTGTGTEASGALPEGGVTKLGISAPQGSQFKINNETTITVGPAEIWESPEGIIITAIECIALADNTTAYVDYATGTVNEDSNFYGARQGVEGKQGKQGEQGVSIAAVEQTTTSYKDDGINVVSIHLTNGETTRIRIKNGSQGPAGETTIVSKYDEDPNNLVVYSAGYINTALNTISSDYIKTLSASGQTITYIKGDNSIGTLTLSGGALPEVTTADNGAFLRVVDGAWVATSLTNAEEVEF